MAFFCFYIKFPGCKYLFVAVVFLIWQDILRNMSQKLSDREALKRPFRRKDVFFFSPGGGQFHLGMLGVVGSHRGTWICFSGDVLGIRSHGIHHHEANDPSG